LAQFKPKKSLTFAVKARCIKNEGFWDAILTIETAIHASGIPPLIVLLLEAKEIRVLYRRGGGFLGFSPVLSIILAEVARRLGM